MEPGYADRGHIMAVEFDRKLIVYWWMMANLGLLVTVVGIIAMVVWIRLDGLCIRSSSST